MYVCGVKELYVFVVSESRVGVNDMIKLCMCPWCEGVYGVTVV